MEKFILRHADKIRGTLSCFDRVIFNGYLPIRYPGGVEGWLYERGIPKKDFKGFALNCAARIKCHAERLATAARRPLIHLQRKVSKDEMAHRIAAEDGIRSGLIAVLTAVEPCRTFRLLYGQRRRNLRIEDCQRKCQFVYYYLRDRILGFMYVRIQTWLPFQVQVYVNGHEWLALRLGARRLRHVRADNAFKSIASPELAQEIADEFVDLPWRSMLDEQASRVNPLLGGVLSGFDYYWCTDQAEYSTDVMFDRPESLQELRPALLDHAIRSFGPDSVMNFLGRKLAPNLEGEVVTDLSHRWPGSRIKHRAGRNWIKLYDKHGSILRAETVINDPRCFWSRRPAIGQGPETTAWRALPKSVEFIGRLEEIGANANSRYLDALAVVPDPSPERRALDALAGNRRVNGKSVTPLNPASSSDAKFIAAVLRGEHLINGFRNKDLRRALHPIVGDHATETSRGRVIGRQLRRLRDRGFISRVPRSHRWKVTPLGLQVLPGVLRFHAHGLEAA